MDDENVNKVIKNLQSIIKDVTSINKYLNDILTINIPKQKYNVTYKDIYNSFHRYNKYLYDHPNGYRIVFHKITFMAPYYIKPGNMQVKSVDISILIDDGRTININEYLKQLNIINSLDNIYLSDLAPVIIWMNSEQNNGKIIYDRIVKFVNQMNLVLQDW